MRTRGLVVLCVLGAAALGGGWYFGTAREPAMQTSVAGGTLMFPGLTAHLADAARIEITHQGTTIALVRLGDKPESPWGLQQRGNYPVQVTKLRGMLTALTELRLVEPRTTDPTMFGRLGLADTDQKDSSADLLRVFDSSAKPIAELLVGHRRVRTEGNVPDEVFVRRPGEIADLAGRGQPAGGRRPAAMARSRHHEHRSRAHCRRRGASWRYRTGFRGQERQAGADRASQCAAARGLQAGRPGPRAGAADLEDVTPDKDAAASKVGDPIGTSVFTTSDGLAVHVTVLKGEKDIWARFSADAAGMAGSDTGR